MEAVEERRAFEKNMRKLNYLGNTLKLAFEFGGVDANSLNNMKDIANWFNEKPHENLDSFINDWLELPEFRCILEKWIKRACALYKYHQMESSVNFKAEQLGEDYVDITNIYEQWRCTIIILLSKHLREGEMIELDGTIYLKGQIEDDIKDDLDSYQKQCFDKLIESGYMCKNGEGYKWKKSKALLAYTMEKLFCHDLEEDFPETKLNKMFGVDRLGKTRSAIHLVNKELPRGFRKIDEILG